MDDLWQAFAKSGSIEDYLKYKENDVRELKNADDSKGLNYQGTDYRGE